MNFRAKKQYLSCRTPANIVRKEKIVKVCLHFIETVLSTFPFDDFLVNKIQNSRYLEYVKVFPGFTIFQPMPKCPRITKEENQLKFTNSLPFQVFRPEWLKVWRKLLKKGRKPKPPLLVPLGLRFTSLYWTPGWFLQHWRVRIGASSFLLQFS